MKRSTQKNAYVSLAISMAVLSLIGAGCSNGSTSATPSSGGQQGAADQGGGSQTNQVPPARSDDSGATSSRRFGRGSMLSGTISKKLDDQSGLTIALQDGSSRDISISASTTMQKFDSKAQKLVDMTFDDLKDGDLVFMMGTTTSDGLYRAVSIREGVPMRGGPRGPGGQGGPPPNNQNTNR
jgi:hypothetical protein